MDNRIIAAHAHCNHNREALLSSKTCGCFHCLNIFSPAEIVEWLDEENGTAVCPYCGIDAVIGNNAGYPITKDFLKEMYLYWFS